MKRTWKKINSKVALSNPWFKVRKDEVVQPDGAKGEYSYVVARPVVVVVAMTEKNEIYILQQFRYPIQKIIWELPGGGTEGQSMLQAAKRELQEETGLIAKHWKRMGKVYGAKAYSDERIDIFLARGLTQTSHNKQSEEGIIKVKKVPIKALLKMIATGEIEDGITIAVITQVLAKLKLIK